MKRTTIEFMIGWLDALRRDDVDALRASLAPDVVWQGLRDEWTCHGPDAVIERSRLSVASAEPSWREPFQARLENLMANYRPLTELEVRPGGQGVAGQCGRAEWGSRWHPDQHRAPVPEGSAGAPGAQHGV